MSDDQLVMGNRANNVPRKAAAEPSPPILTGETVAVVHLRGVVELQRHGDVADATTSPVHTVRAGGQHHAVVMRNNESRGDKGQMCTPDHEPVRTLTTSGHQSILMPYGADAARAGESPASTVTTVDRLALLVPPTTDELAVGERLEVSDDDIDDCRFRMFVLSEIAGAMRLDWHSDGREYIVTGNKRERMAQYGNAVTPPAMALIVARLLDVIQAETFTDMFCGAGGSSLGAEIAGGVMRLGLNHWQRAIDTHSANFEHADHDCADVSLADPRRYPATDILMASPECTNHSLAKGAKRRKPQTASLFDDGPAGDAEQDKSRATMWDVVRFTEAMLTRGKPYKAIVVENVVDAFKWGANDDGGLFASWIMAMDNLGYEHEIVWLNSMFAHHAGLLVPQSRDRMYPVFWLKGCRRPDLRFTPTSWCPACERVVAGVQTWKRLDRRLWGRYGPQYFYSCTDCNGTVLPGAAPAAAIIDDQLPAQRIGDRLKPLASNTRRRIHRGLVRLWNEPFAIRLTHGGTPKPLTLPLVTLTQRHDMAMVMPVAGNTFERTAGNRARHAAERPLDTIHGTLDRAIVVPVGGSHQDRSTLGREPTPTQLGRDCRAVVVPHATGNLAGLAETEPTSTLTRSAKHALVVPPMGDVDARPADHAPAPTQTTTTRAAVVQP